MARPRKPLSKLAPSAFEKNRKRNLAMGRQLEEVQFPKAELDHLPPVLLGDELASAAWASIAPILRDTKVMTLSDVNLLIVYSQTFADLQRDQKQVASEGRTITLPTGVTVKHPLLSVIQANRASVLSISTQFGITPASRANVGFEKPPENVTPSLADI
tara:strand:- start:10488 stop:10964 length:477 start_codon:yes stop_codon:yes gene_type:complete